ncbi:leucine-rich repeat receptor protein kinase EMS1-like [Arachis ipaensis]|uniref:leucine-rich repeat receptor protein kinase EMS1-like n=1 Tax=Arachis ipaensis TaxID=130454 RepID=UPI000A2B7D8C|nr:leucine-rich repeat receptor protein kinase EMS1-like [Arachis ipaensis]XP_020977705.1 leucine-rich repeat receptor protein kinase EMS1-like [Arachis ipaensis]XP_025649972.1 receptor-like protein EIX2 [Arachis hypogaea]
MIQQLNFKYCLLGTMMMNGVVYVVLVVQLLAWTSSVAVVASGKCIESERQALLFLKRGFNVTDDDDWLSSWGDGEQQKECCNWEGVKCSNVTGHVLMLDLHADYYTRGSISPSLGELHHLKYLDLSGHHFTHTPSIPHFIASLTFLTHLNLSSCSFTGKIPPQLGNLLFLEYLDLGGNAFDYSQRIPSQFSNLSHLVYLDLSFNYLVGEFPLQLTNMSSLTYLDLSHNNFNGTLPPQLGNLLSLEHLDLSGNAFTGTIPSQFKNISRLQYLDLSLLDKTVPINSDLQWLSQLSTMRYLSLPWVNLSSASNWQQQVSSLSHLQYLDLNGCNLVDSVPTSSLASPANFSTSLSYVDISYNSLRDASFIFPWLMNSTGSLVTLRMNDNGLTGTIPETFGDLSSLEELNLANNELKGQIPLSLFHSCNLVELHLSKNKLTGEFHEYIREFSRCAHKPLKLLDMGWNEITGMVSDLSQLQSLEELRLGNNRLNGSIHEGIGELSNLTELSLGNNLLKGLISETHFSRLYYLESLDLSHNALVFNVSDDWVPLFNLSNIYLACCKLGPNFPTWLHTQTMIENLDISCAGISSTVPNWFWEPLSQMLNLNISYNRFRGKIESPILPAIVSDQPRSIDLSFNLFEGPIPAFLSTTSQTFLSNNSFSIANPLLCANSTKNMRFMDLSNNDLRGELSDCWRGFESLVVLDLSNNQFYGNMPKSLGSLRNIQSIHLGGNNFSGEIPSSLHNCTQLQIFDAARNKLSGRIPSWIGDNIPKLLVLSLHSNNFHGNIPLNMCNLYELRVLDLSLNILSGSIPKCISNLSAMATQEKSNATITHDYHYEYRNEFSRDDAISEVSGVYNDSASLTWKGKMSKYGSTLGLLRSIDFSSNRLTGEIPTEMMTLIGLVSLNISRNFFSGHIPPTIGQLKSIDFLDLSRNHLSGTIPSQLVQIDDLSVLDLSYNDLSGEIPLGTQLQTRDASAYAGNPKLCGAPLNNTCPIHGHQISEHDADGDDDEQFVSEGFYIAMAAGFVMAFWGVCFSLILKKSWRYAYFKLLSDVYDNLYVFTAIKVAKFKRIRSQI